MPLTLKTDYGRIVVAKLRKELKTRALFNENYRGEAAAGAVMIPVTPATSLIDYNKGSIGSNTVSYAENSYINCAIDQDKALSKYIDGYQANALPYEVLMDELEKAGYAFALAEDTHAINTLKYAINGKDKGGSNAFGSTDPRYQKTGTVVSLGAADIYEKIVEIFGAQTDKGVKTENRWALVNGKGFGLILASNKAIRQSDLSQEIVMRGALAMIGGYEVYVSGNLTGTQSVSEVDKDIYAIFGHADFCTRVEAFVVEPFVVDGNGDANVVGGSFVKGRFVFTHEVLQPDAFWLLCAWLTTAPEDAETSVMGKKAKTLQSGISIDPVTNVISGTLKHVTGYTGYSGSTELQSGNFLALKITPAADNTLVWKTQLIGGVGPEVAFDEDLNCVYRITSTNQIVRINGYDSDNNLVISFNYPLSGLTLETE